MVDVGGVEVRLNSDLYHIYGVVDVGGVEVRINSDIYHNF